MTELTRKLDRGVWLRRYLVSLRQVKQAPPVLLRMQNVDDADAAFNGDIEDQKAFELPLTRH